jgi:hypothetical protein
MNACAYARIHPCTCVCVCELHLEGFGVVEIEIGGAIAQNKRLAVRRRAPALQYACVRARERARVRVCLRVCVRVCVICVCVYRYIIYTQIRVYHLSSVCSYNVV